MKLSKQNLSKQKRKKKKQEEIGEIFFNHL